jgi:hypothetical protein
MEGGRSRQKKTVWQVMQEEIVHTRRAPALREKRDARLPIIARASHVFRRIESAPRAEGGVSPAAKTASRPSSRESGDGH